MKVHLVMLFPQTNDEGSTGNSRYKPHETNIRFFASYTDKASIYRSKISNENS